MIPLMPEYELLHQLNKKKKTKKSSSIDQEIRKDWGILKKKTKKALLRIVIEIIQILHFLSHKDNIKDVIRHEGALSVRKER